MTRKVYRDIAKSFSTTKNSILASDENVTIRKAKFQVWDMLLNTIADDLKQDNPNFSYDLFRDACENG